MVDVSLLQKQNPADFDCRYYLAKLAYFNTNGGMMMPLCGRYPEYTHKIVVDTTDCIYNNRTKRGWMSTCKRDGSRRGRASCKKCPYFKPTFRARIKAAIDILAWKNVGKCR